MFCNQCGKEIPNGVKFCPTFWYGNGNGDQSETGGFDASRNHQNGAVDFVLCGGRHAIFEFRDFLVDRFVCGIRICFHVRHVSKSERVCLVA